MKNIIEYLREKWFGKFKNSLKNVSIELTADSSSWLKNINVSEVNPTENLQLSENYIISDILTGYNFPKNKTFHIYYEFVFE